MLSKYLKHRKRLSLSLFLALLVGIVLPSSALADAKLFLSAPAGVPASALTVTVRQGIPSGWSVSEQSSSYGVGIYALPEVPQDDDGGYLLDTPGTYCYYVKATGYYTILKLFNVSAADVANNRTITRTMETGPIGAKGYEPGNPNLVNAPSNYDSLLGDGGKIVSMFTDELSAHFTTDNLIGYKGFTTPAFTKTTLAKNEFTSQEDLMAFVNDLAAKNSHVHSFVLGQTANYNFDLPILIITKSAIPDGATFDEAVKIIKDNGKLNVWYQGQIHPNEPAAGEAALVMLQEMAGNYGNPLLDKINYIAIPRINPEGSYMFTRVTYGGFDMNRDHMRLQAIELDYIHGAYSKIMPEVVMDSHEFGFWGIESNGYMIADDIQVTPASSLNNSSIVNAFAMNVVSSKIHSALAAAGLRNNHYGYTVNNPIGRAYYGLFNSISILIETRGIGAGKQNFDRRVFSQVVTAKSVTETAAAHADEIREMAASARAKVVADGAVYDEEDQLILHQIASGNTHTPFLGSEYVYDLNGNQISKSSPTLSMNDTIVRSRTRPTAYVFPKNMPGIDLALYITDSQGGEYYEIAPGSVVPLQQYYYAGEYTYNGRNAGFEAGLHPQTNVTFADGAYVIPMDQVAGNVLGMLWEPDVNDSNGYNGTLVQSKIIEADDSGNYPYYRFTGNNPREALPKFPADPDPDPDPDPDGGSSSGCNAGFAGIVLLMAISTVMATRKKAR